ncbi:MAG TPA: pyridoxamine 5'-phosphate oxidase family protein [Opitutales bacterium]|nr:pyridoxamine 5'-phosphate oxidase family protein [Opitutales bacterium]
MRRAEKEITSREEIDAVINAATVCRVAMVNAGRPHIVPLSFGYDGACLYFHSAPEGEKIDILRESPEVCAEFEDGVEIRRGNNACNFSMNYKSVIARGMASFVTDPVEKRIGLDCIVRKYADADVPGFPDAALASVAVIRVRIDSLTGKRSAKPSAPR